jgi:hypothetical protein
MSAPTLGEGRHPPLADGGLGSRIFSRVDSMRCHQKMPILWARCPDRDAARTIDMPYWENARSYDGPQQECALRQSRQQRK